MAQLYTLADRPSGTAALGGCLPALWRQPANWLNAPSPRTLPMTANPRPQAFQPGCIWAVAA